ncbi:MAG: aldo/keto reductase [Zhaonellaceae bacterium]
MGYGAWGLGGGWWGGSDKEESIKALNMAIDNGVNFIDSALGYEESEKIVGEVVRSRSEKIYVTSKIPPKNFVFPAKPGTPISEAYPTDWIY